MIQKPEKIEHKSGEPLTKSQVLEIKRLHVKEKMSATEIAEKFNLAFNCVKYVLQKLKCYKTGLSFRRGGKRFAQSVKEKNEMIQMVNNGVPVAEVAKQFDVRVTKIYRIIGKGGVKKKIKKIKEVVPNTMRNVDKHESAMYACWKKCIMEIGKNKCCLSGDFENLCVHHLFNWADHPERKFDLQNGIVLASWLHVLFHSEYGSRENNPTQFREFKKRYKNGEFQFEKFVEEFMDFSI